MARRPKDNEVAEIEAEYDYYTNIVETENLDDEGETVGYRYEIRRWRYGSHTVLCSWTSKEKLTFDDARP